ncbi:PTS transporter subunit IIC [Carnobacterium sp. CS13]|uniref:PTS transporter subunit IIC n=1 Tax=Carnobacterium sp. CS13 TaxID=2800128 RepID=UPI001913B52C|nr:PTS transporter subunit IIC [Carnobacterium sp. CS13]QQP69464.1 PTS transporter subunit IIC [Carnobacterium sp. CS13]
MSEQETKLSAKIFFNRVLAGTATGIVVGLIPNAILGELFKYLGTKMDVFISLLHVVQGFQYSVPIIVGVLIAMQFKLNPMQTIIVGAAALVGSGAYVITDGAFMLVGIGDLINTMLTASLAVILVRAIGNKLGSMTILLLPIIAGAGAGAVGSFTLPYVKMITSTIGTLINSFTELQPILMSVLIAVSFSILIISPISTVAIATAIGLSGLASGAANIGICAAAATLVIGSMKVNSLGVTSSVGLGAMKMMMPNLIKHPIICLPIAFSAVISAVFAALFNIQGTPFSAGFGFSGLVGPINAVKFMEGSAGTNIGIAVLVFFVIPFASAFIGDLVFGKVLKIYDKDIFKFFTAK